jgi:hypothetical protein
MPAVASRTTMIAVSRPNTTPMAMPVPLPMSGTKTVIQLPSTNAFDEQEIEILLEPDFKKSRRSDTFDSIMSI